MELDEERARERLDKTDKLDKELDLRHIKPTDLKHNIRINPPTEATKQSEAEITVQQLALINCIKDYYMTIDDNSELTKDEQIGKKRLSKRVKDNQIMITFTDKDSRVVVCSPDDYNRAAHVHIVKDVEVDHNVIEPTITLMNRISK